jgi:hypothetical protein
MPSGRTILLAANRAVRVRVRWLGLDLPEVKG